MYTTEPIARQLKVARAAKGLSQRALAKRVGVPQSHISKIENGAVDLRLSSLIELARALDLEVILAPRKTLPAVRSIVRSSAPSTSAKALRTTNRAYGKLQENLKLALEDNPTIKEIAQLQRNLKALQRLQVSPGLDAIQDANKTVEAFRNHTKGLDDLRRTLEALQHVRNAAAHDLPQVERVKPAYSLDDDDG